MLLALRSLWELISATASITEAADSLASTATGLVSASASITEAADSVAATATVLVSATASITEAADSLAATATVADSASEASTEADDTLAATVHLTDFKAFTFNFTVLGLGAYSRVPFGSFAGKAAPADSKVFVQNFTVLGLGGYSRVPWGSFAGRAAAATEDPLGDYSLIPLYRRRKKHLEEELEQLALRLRDIAIDIPLPGHSFPVIYNRPLLSPFIEQKQQQTLDTLISRAKAEAEYQARLKREQDDDDEAAILLLWP